MISLGHKRETFGTIVKGILVETQYTSNRSTVLSSGTWTIFFASFLVTARTRSEDAPDMIIEEQLIISIPYSQLDLFAVLLKLL
jgi:hypothetical protein